MNRAVTALFQLSLACLLAVVFSNQANAQLLPAADTPEGKIIRSIDVQYLGAAVVDRNRILANMKLREGLPFSSEDQQEDIINLRERRIVEFVDIDPEVKGNAVDLTVTVMATGTLGSITFEGQTRFDNKELADQVNAELGQPLDEEKLLEGKFNIEELYREKGFSDVSATYRTAVDRETGFTQVIYGIVEGQSNKLRKIFFQGNTAIPSKELRKVMATKQRGIWSRITGKDKVDNLMLEDDKSKVVNEFRNRGYMDAQVTRQELRRVDPGSDYIDLILYVYEGPLYTISDIRIGQNSKFSNAELAGALKLAPGQQYSAKAIDADAQALEDYYGRQGYADARVTTRIDTLGSNQVRVNHAVREGQLSYIRKINIGGMEWTKDEVIRRELLVQPGEVFDTVKLRKSRQILENMQFFEPGSIDITPEDTGQPGYKDINIQVAEGKTGSFQVGGAFTSVENVFGYVSFSEANFDIGNWNNFPPRGDGQKFNFNLRYGTRTKDFLMGFTEPWFLGKRLALGGEVFWREQLYLSSEYSQRVAGGALWLRHPISDNTRLQLEYRAQEYQIFDLDDDELVDLDGDGIRETLVPGTSPEIAAEEGTYFESKMTLELLQDTRDSNSLPRTGHKLSLSTSFSGGFLGGDVDTYNLSGAFTQHASLPFDHILTFHAEANIADTWSDGDRVPIFNRHFLGGAYNLRGFDYRDVGPVDNENEPLGGGTSAYTTVEYSVPVADRLRLHAFVDAGFVNADSYDFSTSELNADVGMGVRLIVPAFGPIRLDYAFPIKRSDHQGSGGQFNFRLDFNY